MMLRTMYWWWMLACLLLIAACKKASFELDISHLNTGTNYDLYDIVIVDSDTIYAVGGTRFEAGIFIASYDGGTSWTCDTIAPYQLNSIHVNDNHDIATVGFVGLFYTSHRNTGWWKHNLPSSQVVNAVAYYNNVGILVGGGSYSYGMHLSLDTLLGGVDRPSIFIDSLEHELSDVCFTDYETAHAVGYGIVMRTIDNGYTWEVNGIQGDFFKAVHFPSPDIGYAVGYSGSIIKTDDGGDNWEKQRNGNNLFVSNKRFVDVFFSDTEKGYIVGDCGLFWRTTNGGEDWTIIKGLEDINLTSIKVANGIGFITGQDGQVFRFVD